MSFPLLITVVVATYNRPRALAAVLAALGDQDYRAYEVVVADDGSTRSTAEVVEQHCVKGRYSLIHVWQPDEGFRLAEIRNKAIMKSTGDYVIFLDGDCIPRPHFVSRHAALAERGNFVTGHRVLLSKKATEKVLSTGFPIHQLSLNDWLWWRLTGRVNRTLPFVSLPDSGWRKINQRKWNGAIGCNIAIWRNDLETVNGYDARYRGWGLEDSDLVIRLFNSGVFRKEGRFATAVIHLWHEEQDRSRFGGNRKFLQSVIESGATRAVEGLDR